MKSKGTLYFLIVVSIVVAAVGLDYWNDLRTEDQKSEQSKIFSVQKDDIIEVNLKNSSGELVLKKQSEGWFIESPIKELADQDSVAEFIEALVLDKHVQTIKADSGSNLDIYGLSSPRGFVSLKSIKGDVQKVEIGKKNLEDNVYIKTESKTEIFVGLPVWETRLQKVLFDFRQKRILKVTTDSVSKISISRGKENIVLEKENGQWKYLQRADWRISTDLVQQWLENLIDSDILEYTKENQISAEDKKKYGLNKPMASVKIKHGNSELQTEWGVGSDKLHYLYYQNKIYKFPVEKAQKVYSLDVNLLRETKTAVYFNVETAASVSVYMNKRNYDFTKKDGRWVLQGSDEKFSVDRLKSILVQLSNLKVKSFIPDTKKLLSKPDYMVLVKNNQGNLLASFEIESIAETDKPSKVKSNLSSDVFEVEMSNLRALSFNDLIIQETENEKGKSTHE